MPFNPNKYLGKEANRYETYLSSLNFNKEHLDKTIRESVKNLQEKKAKSFVIYGEPQSGKTSMMIGLTAKLLDSGYKFIVILVQDNLNLLEQNFLRFQQSTLSPSPKIYKDIEPPDVNIKDRDVVVFCKKNKGDLERLINKADNIKNKIVIDDEADFASPNAQVNKKTEEGKQKKTAINREITDLLGSDGIYIGVTATPIRIDVNRTFNNENHHWVFFKAHESYKGQDFFFPPKSGKKINYNLTQLGEETYDAKKDLKNAVIRFLVNVAYVNKYENKSEKNYIMLVHTNVRKVIHSEDKAVVEDVMSDLTTPKIKGATNQKYLKVLELIYKQAEKKTNNEVKADEITAYVARNASQHLIGVLNSEPQNKDHNLKLLTEEPANKFTFAIGGNIISRGITFNNLLSMYFTRSVKGLMQQDTYIQRARMFGSRSDIDMKHFELTIPSKLFHSWHTCFFLHRISYLSARSNSHPVWATGLGTKAVAPSSIDKSQVLIEKGEMSFNRIKYEKEMDDIINEHKEPDEKYKALELLVQKFGDNFLHKHIMAFITESSNNIKTDIAIHKTVSIDEMDPKYVDKEQIARPRGFLGGRDFLKYPYAKHHFVLVKNKKGFCRFVYNCVHGKISFISTTQENL